jgi:hypothetical protein
MPGSPKEIAVGDKNDDYDLGREIERSWLIRGEYDRVFAARGMAMWIFLGLCVVAAIITLIVDGLGINW